MGTKSKGVFICIEGLDGSGKTTQAHRLVAALNSRGYRAVYTTEPSEGDIGRMIRTQLLEGDSRFPVLEATLFAADRINHLENDVVPLLEAGRIVVCDRYVYSSIAYQGAAGLSIEWIAEINKYAREPDLALYIDLPPEIVIRRIRRRRTVMENPQTQEKVREVYLELVAKQKLTLIDGAGPPSNVAAAIEKLVIEFLETK